MSYVVLLIEIQASNLIKFKWVKKIYPSEQISFSVIRIMGKLTAQISNVCTSFKVMKLRVLFLHF